MNFEIKRDGDISVLTIKTESLDSNVAPDLKSRFIMLASDEETVHLIVDLSRVTFADSSGLGALLLAQRLYRENEGVLILASVTDRVKKLVEISQLSNVFVLADDVDEAINQINETEGK